MKEKNNLKQIIDFRKAKLQDIKSANINPYPYSYISTARPGSRAPHVWLKDGSAICDHFGTGFTLLKFNTVKSIDRLFFAAN